MKGVWPNREPVRYAVEASRGVWRSLVACFVRDEEVVGSNPATPTNVNRIVDSDRFEHLDGAPAAQEPEPTVRFAPLLIRNPSAATKTTRDTTAAAMMPG